MELVDGGKGPDGATVDHVEPIVLDPERVYRDDELVACCRRDNGIKSDRTMVRTNYANRRWLPSGLP